MDSKPKTDVDGDNWANFAKDLLQKELEIDIHIYQSKEEQYNIGESKEGFEFKLDRRCSETGNISIEIAEKRNGNNASWIPSGIERGDNTLYYVQGNYNIIYVFWKKTLQKIYRDKHSQNRSKSNPLGWWEPKPTLRTFWMKKSEAEKWALLIMKITNGIVTSE